MRELRWILAIVGVAAAAQLAGVSRPFLRHHESAGTQYGKHARNHLKFGLSFTKGVMLDVSGPSLTPYGDPRAYFYPDHPPLPALLLAAGFALFGVHEAVLRGLLIGFTMAAILLFWRLARRRLEWPWSGIATAAFAWNPMFLYFSVVTVHQVNTLCGILAALLFYARWRESGRRRDYAGLVGAIVFACLCDWPGYYAAAAIAVSHFATTREKRGAVAALLLLNVAVFGLYLLQIGWTGGDGVAKLLRIGVSRSAVELPPLHRYALSEAREIGLYFTLPLVAVAALGIAHRRRDVSLWALLLLAADEVVFAAICREHDYYSYYLVVFLALATGEGARVLAVRWRPLAWAAAALFLAQSGWVLAGRLTREGGYEFYHRLAGAIEAVTRPEDKLVLLTEDIRFYTPFYADRYSAWYDRKGGELLVENSGGRRKPFGRDDLVRLLEENREGFRYAVTADREGIRRNVGVLAGADDALLRSFGVHDDDRGFLAGRCGPPLEKDGFLFWRLPRQP